MAFATIRVDGDGPVGHLTLDRPERLNPLGRATLDELAEAAVWFDDRPHVKVVVVSGAGRAFSAGADLASFSGPAPSPAEQRDAADAGRRMADALSGMRAISIAAIRGHCVGGGVVLAIACDLRLAAASTRFSIPEIDLGLPLTWGGIPRLVREIGPAMARELVLTGRSFDAPEAKRVGLVNRVVADGDLDREVAELAELLATRSAFTLDVTKRAVAAASEAMVSTGGAWADADQLVTALADEESRQVGRAYRKRRATRGTQ